MYIQIKTACGIKYVYVVESYRKDNGSISHRIVKSLGRYEDFIKDDPDALIKLKEEVKSCSKELRNNKIVETLRNVQAVSKTQMASDVDFTEGFPRLNYANYILRNIWKHRLRLDYRLGYLQKQYHADIDSKISLSDLLFAEVFDHMVPLDREDRLWGHDLGVLGVNFNPDEHKRLLKLYGRDLYVEINHIYDYMYDRLESREESHHLATHINTDFSFDYESENPDGDGFDIKSIDDDTVNKNLTRLVEQIAYVFTLIINCKLSQINEGASADDIQKAFVNADILVEYSMGSSSSFVYTKAGNGRYIRLLNNIMRSLELTPLLNVQDRIELAKRLRAKFSDDSAVIPLSIYERVMKYKQKDPLGDR